MSFQSLPQEQRAHSLPTWGGNYIGPLWLHPCAILRPATSTPRGLPRSCTLWESCTSGDSKYTCSDSLVVLHIFHSGVQDRRELCWASVWCLPLSLKSSEGLSGEWGLAQKCPVSAGCRYRRHVAEGERQAGKRRDRVSRLNLGPGKKMKLSLKV